MADERMKRHEDCEEEECIPVKPCRKSKPFPVRIVEDCDPIPVTIDSDCKPIPVRLHEDCKPIPVKIKQEDCEPVIVKQEKGHCWRVKGCKDSDPVQVQQVECVEVQGCEDGFPINVNIVNQQPPPAANVNMHVFNGTTWEPFLTPSKFIELNNTQVPTTPGGSVVWMPSASLRFRLMGFYLTANLSGQVDFRDGIGGTVISSQVVQAGIPFAPPLLGNGIKSSVVGNPLVIEFVGGPGGFVGINGLITGQETP